MELISIRWGFESWQGLEEPFFQTLPDVLSLLLGIRHQENQGNRTSILLWASSPASKYPRLVKLKARAKITAGNFSIVVL